MQTRFPRNAARMTVVAGLVLAGLLVQTVPTSLAFAAGCSLPSAAPDVPAPVLVSTPFPNGLGGACGPPAGSTFSSTAAPCPLPPFVGPLPGEFCGPLIMPGASITCTAVTATAHADQLVIGLDLFPYDGNVVGGEPLAHDATPTHGGTNTATITNPSLLPARVIAYPICPELVGSVLVGCA